MTFAKEEKSTTMMFWFTALVMVLHIKTVYWLQHPVMEFRETLAKPIEMVILPIPKKPVIEPIAPKPEIRPIPPKPLPKPVEKPQSAKPKAVAPSKPVPVQIAEPIVNNIPIAKLVTAPALPVAVAPEQAVSVHQAPATAPIPSGVSHAKAETQNYGDSDDEAYVKGHLVSSHKPEYPTAAKNRHLEGKVTVLYKVGADGSVDDVSVSNSSGSDLLDEAALDAAREDNFAPARRGNKPVASNYSKVFTFHLTDSD